MRVRFKQFKDCKDHNIKVECTKLSLLPVPGRAHQKKETLTKKSESHLDPQTAKSLCYSIPSGTSTCLTNKKLAEFLKKQPYFQVTGNIHFNLL
jgi:hypothetical protein